MDAVIVTGAGVRIGAAIARHLAAEGWHVFVHYNSSGKAAERVAGEIAAAGGSAETIRADLSSSEACLDLPRRCAKAAPVRALVNNASVFDFDTWETLTPELLDRQIAVNARAPLLVSQAFAKSLPPDEHGAIVNILDQKLWNLQPDFFSYTLSKNMLWCATQMLAQALAPSVRVNAVAPGLTLRSGEQSDADFEATKRHNLLARAPDPGDVARAVSYLLGAEAVTGQAILADSGEHLVAPDRAMMASKRPN